MHEFLQNFLEMNVSGKDYKLAVLDPKLGGVIQETLSVSDSFLLFYLFSFNRLIVSLIHQCLS